MGAVRRASARARGEARRPVLLQAQALPPGRIEELLTLGILPALCLTPPPSHCESRSGTGAAGGSAEDTAIVRLLTTPDGRFTAYHDAPAARPDPLHVLAFALDLVNGAGPASGDAANAALRSVTLWAAWQHFEERNKGSLAPGKIADMVVLSANPLVVSPRAVMEIRVEETIKEGATIWLRDSEEAQGDDGYLSCFASDACRRSMAAAFEGQGGGTVKPPELSTGPRPLSPSDSRDGSAHLR
jgi:hypothetical protein